MHRKHKINAQVRSVFIGLITAELIAFAVSASADATGVTFPLQCRHCEDPRCIQACMSGAMSKDSGSGLVANDPDRCVGCWMCDYSKDTRKKYLTNLQFAEEGK